MDRDELILCIVQPDEAAGIAELKRLMTAGHILPSMGLDEDGFSIFYWAVSHGRNAIIQLLIESGFTLACECDAAKTGKRPETTSLHLAVERDDAEATSLLLTAGC